MQLIVRRAQTLTLASGAAIALKPLAENAPGSSPQAEMTCRASAGEDAPAVGARFHVGTGFSGECVREGKALRCDDADMDSRVDRESCRNLGIRSMVAVPVHHDGSVFGIIEIFSELPKAFTEVDVAELEGLAHSVAAEVEKAQRPIEPAKNSMDHVASPAPLAVAMAEGSNAPRLLLKAKPAHLIFAENLVDIILRRNTVKPASASAGEPLWRDVFIDSSMPWSRFRQSVLWHMAVVAALWNVSPGWQGKVQFHPLTSSNSSVTYYRPTSFPSAGSNHPRLRSPRLATSAAMARKKIRVPRERAQASVAPPQLKLSPGARLQQVAWNPATALVPRTPVLAAPALGNAMAQRQLSTGSLRGPGIGRALVAPAPAVESVSGRRGGNALEFSVVAPAPDAGPSIRSGGSVTAGSIAVVGPPPALPFHERATGSGMTLGGAANSVVPPPVSLEGSRTGLGGMSGETGGQSVVPPPVSLEGSGTALRGSGRAGGGDSVVPPPVSLEGSGSLASGGASSLAKLNSEGMPPTPALRAANNAGSKTDSAAMMIRPAARPPQPAVDDDPMGRGPQELPVRLIGLAFSLPHSSFFSNYEVYVAEKRIAKAASQLIKLVYEFRPYQRRMSEFNGAESRVYKLRVTRDSTCDETVQQMTGNPDSKLQSLVDHPQWNSDPNRILPCYRTTADDYRKALSRSH